MVVLLMPAQHGVASHTRREQGSCWWAGFDKASRSCSGTQHFKPQAHMRMLFTISTIQMQELKEIDEFKVGFGAQWTVVLRACVS